MKNIYAYYKENITLHNEKVEKLRKIIHLIGTIRLAIVAATVVTLWVCREENWQWWVAILVLYGIPFAALMLYHNRLSKQKAYAEAMIALNTNELKALDYDFSAFDGAAEKSSAEHSFSLDLDLFGERSLFQSINRTVTEQGKETLADWFRMPLSQKQEILKRQEAIRELAGMPALRQHFYVTGRKRTSNKKDSADLNTLTEGQYYFLKSRFWKAMTWLIPLLWIVILAGFAFNRISGGMVGLFFAISFVLANITGRQINQLYQTVNKMEKIFATYADLMQNIETTTFQSEALQTIAHQLTGEKGLTASQAIKQLSRYIGGLDQRYSAAGILLNIFYLRDTRHALCLERWK